MDLNNIISLSISYGPTLLFILILTLAIVRGILRGFRKSIILAVHALIAFLICFVLFLVLSNSEAFDIWILNVANTFIPGTLQSRLGVSETCLSLREIFVEYLPKQLNYVDGLSLILAENGAYLRTLADLSFRVTLFSILEVVYLLLLIIFYIIYLIFYPERKVKKRKERAFIDAKIDRSYQKHCVAGGAIGAIRGLIKGTIVLSFLGTLFFIIAGGNGTKEYNDYSFGNENVDLGYVAYKEINSYGTKGIFKILNSISDPNDTPYYLYAADLVFQGNLDDDSRSLSETIYFRDEIGAYTSFTSQTVDLLMKYGSNDIRDAIMNNKDIMDVVVDIIMIEEFQIEFSDIINEFDSKTYFVNLTLSLVDSIVQHIDELGFTNSINSTALELIKLLFKEGYYSDVIPEEVLLEQSEIETKLPCIKASSALTKNDISIIYNILISYLNIDDYSSEDEILNVTKDVIGQVSRLSILSSDRKDELNGVLGRLYNYIGNKFLRGNTIEVNEETYLQNIEGINWIDELNKLVDVSKDLIQLYQNIDLNQNDYLQVLKEALNSKENMELFDNVLLPLSDSKILGGVLSTNFIYSYALQALNSIYDNTYLDKNIRYDNTYENGVLTSYGEVFNVLSAIKLICTEDVINPVLDAISQENISQAEIISLLDSLADSVYITDDYGNTFADLIVNSEIVRSVISNCLINNTNLSEDIKLYITDESKDYIDDEYQNLIKKEEFTLLLNSLPELLEIVEKIENNADSTELIDELLKSDVLISLLDSKIIEGTISGYVLNYISSVDSVIVPKYLNDVSNWVESDKDGELKRIINIFRSIDFNMSLIDDTDKLLEKIRSLDVEQCDMMTESLIMYYTISNYLVETKQSLELIVPNSSKEILEYDEEKLVINQTELVSLLSHLDLLLPSDESSETLIINIVKYREELLVNKIILATIVNYLVNDEEFTTNTGDVIAFTNTLLSSGEKENLMNFDYKNPWIVEGPALFRAIDEILRISIREDEISFEEETIVEEFRGAIENLTNESFTMPGLNKLEVCYKSDSIVLSLSKQVEETFKGIIDESVFSSAKENDVFPYTEMKSIIDSVYIFNIDMTDTIDLDKITQTIVENIANYNVPRTEEKFNNMTTLDIIYESVISRFLFTRQFDKELVNGINLDYLKIAKDENDSYTKEEVSYFIDGVNILGIKTVETSELEKYLKDNVLNMTDDTIIVLYKSYIIKYFLSISLNNALEELVPSEILNSDTVKTYDETNEEMLYYRINEIQALLSATKELDIDFDNIKQFNYEGIINTLLNDSTVDPSVRKIDLLYSSSIVAYFISDSMTSLINSNTLLMDHPYAYRTDIKIYKKLEIVSVLEIISNTNLNNYDIKNIDINRVIDYIYTNESGTLSYLITAFVSKALLSNNELIVTKNDLDGRSLITENIMKPIAIRALYDGISSSEIDLYDFDASKIVIKDVKTILASESLCATITNNIRINGSTCYVYTTNAKIIKDALNNDIIILSNTELEVILTTMSKLTSKSISFQTSDVLNLNSSDFEYALGSSIIVTTLSDYFVSTVETLKALTKNFEVYDISTSIISINKYLPKETILNYKNSPLA